MLQEWQGERAIPHGSRARPRPRAMGVSRLQNTAVPACR